MNWPEAVALVGVSWGMMSLPLAILIRNYKINRAMLDFKDKNPDVNVRWVPGDVKDVGTESKWKNWHQ